MEPDKYDLFFKIGNNVYLGATIRFLPEKIELFYHFPKGGRVPAEHICENGFLPEAQPEYLPDHISFHKDGTIHATAKDGRKSKIHVPLQKIGMNIFNVQKNHFLPIFLESIYLTDVTIEQHLKKVDKATSKYVFDVTNLNSFSIILVVKCERTNPNLWRNDHGFERLTYVPPVIWADLFTAGEKKNALQDQESSGFDSQLMILVVENVWHEFAPLNYTNFDIANHRDKLVQVLMPPLEEISKMINKNALAMLSLSKK